MADPHLNDLHLNGLRDPDFSVAFDLLPVPFVMVMANDPVFTFIAVNQAYEALSGVGRADLLGRSVFEVFPDDPDDPGSTGSTSLRASYRRVIATRAPDQMPVYRYDVVRPGGFDVRYFSSRNTPVLNADGEVQSIIESVEEVTGRVRAQEQADAALRHLQTIEKRFRQLTDSTGVGLVVAASDGGLSYANPAVLRLLGYSAEEVAAGLVRWDHLTPPEFAARDAEAWREILSTGKCVPYEKVYIAKSGRRVPILIAASLLESSNSQTEVAAIIVDLTERKENEKSTFLVRLDHATRELSEPDEVVQAACRLLGEYLQADRCGYCSFRLDEETLELTTEYTRTGVPGIAGRYTLSQFGADTVRLFRANLPDVVNDTETAPLGGDVRAFYRQAAIRAHASVPLHKAGKLVAAIAVHQLTPRKWLPEEVHVIQLVANRCSESIERVRATRALHRSERRLRLAQRAARIGTFEWVFGDNLITWSPELEALYDLPEGAFEGTLDAWRNLVAAEDVERIAAELKTCFAERKTEYGYELRAVLPDGRLRWLRGQGQIFYNDSGPDRMIGVNIDIDTQKQAEAHLRQQWHTFDTVLSNTPDAIYIFDEDGRFRYANRTLLARLSTSLQDVIGKDGSALGYKPEVVTHIKGQIRDVFRNAQPVRDEMPFSLPGGEFRHFEYILVPVFGDDGKVEAVAGSTRDITERKRAEELEHKRQEQVRESARLESLGIMAGGIAHDFNNLLTGILGNASLLAEMGNEQDVPFAREIVLAAERAAELTSKMLAYSGRGRFEIEVLDLNALIHENLTLLRASLPRTVSVELDLTGEFCGIEADRAQVQQVVMNLLLNAAEAAGDRPGRVVVRTVLVERTSAWVSERLQTSLPGGPYAVLEVRDDGCGMSPDTMKRIFDPFFTTKFTGRGLGLAAVLGIIKGHHGDIEVESEPGCGTLFRVSLPATQRTASRPVPTPLATVHSRNVRVLVVDDEELVRRTIKSALESRGLSVIEASGGPEALEIFREDGGISAVILDLTMPVMSGDEAVTRMQAIRPETPIVLSSGYSEAELVQRFGPMKLAGFLQKPYTASAIVESVTHALEKKESRL